MDNETNQHGGLDLPPVLVKREYVAIFSDGSGGLWFLVLAPSAEAVSTKYPLLKVFSVANAPSVETMDLERMRVFVGPGVDPLKPVRHRSQAEQEQFLAYRERVLREVERNNERSRIPHDVAERIRMAPLWVDIDDDEAFLEYLGTLPPPYDR